jgi:hypothetical protein
MSRFDVTSTLGGVVKMRGNQARSAIETIERLGIMHRLVKRL